MPKTLLGVNSPSGRPFQHTPLITRFDKKGLHVHAQGLTVGTPPCQLQSAFRFQHPYLSDWSETNSPEQDFHYAAYLREAGTQHPVHCTEASEWVIIPELGFFGSPETSYGVLVRVLDQGGLFHRTKTVLTAYVDLVRSSESEVSSSILPYYEIRQSKRQRPEDGMIRRLGQ